MKKKYGLYNKISNWSAVKGVYTKRLVGKNTRRLGKKEAKKETENIDKK